MRLFSILCISLVMVLFSRHVTNAQVPGIWIGSEEVDSITDKKNSLAFIYDDNNQGSVALRCQNGEATFFVRDGEKVAQLSQTSITLRIDDNPPKVYAAIATDPELFALNAPAKETMLPMLSARRFAVRLVGAFGRTITMTFSPALRPNTLHMVGRVLANCGLAPYPKAEIDLETQKVERGAGKTREKR